MGKMLCANNSAWFKIDLSECCFSCNDFSLLMDTDL